MKIGILQTGRSPESIVEEHGDYDAFFKRYLDGRGFEFVTYEALDGSLPTSPQDADGWLITGSRFGAYEDHDWIPPLEEFLRATFAAQVPIFGVCFGHQILAQALGGKVEKFSGGWSVGPTAYQSQHFGEQKMIAWHQDQVTKRPEMAEVAGSSDFCENAILVYGDQALTIQPHPEFTAEFMEDLLQARGKILPQHIQDGAIAAKDDPLTRISFADTVEAFFKKAALMIHTSSYYAATANPDAQFPQLTSDITADVAIIGGGFTGVATALELAERGLSVVLCEANQIGWGATGRNGGQITGSLSGDKAMEREFRRTLGDKAADFVWNLRWRGHDIIRKRIAKYNIDCDLKFGHMQTALTSGQLSDLQTTYDQGCANGMSADLEMISKVDMPDYLETDLYIGGLLNRKNMHLHSLNFCLGQAQAVVSLGGQVFENSEVIDIEHGKQPLIRTQHGSVRADKIMLAGNAYHFLEQKKLRGKLFPASLANMATAPLSDEDAAAINPHNLAVYDGRFVLDYYRLTADNRVMFGGGTNYSGRDSNDVVRDLRPALERTFPRLKGIDIDYTWSGMDGIILNRIPQVGRIGSNVFYVQGYSGHGIALSHILAEITSQCICGDSTEFEVFENCRHWKLPIGRTLGSMMIALGMTYYTMRDKIER